MLPVIAIHQCNAFTIIIDAGLYRLVFAENSYETLILLVKSTIQTFELDNSREYDNCANDVD